MTREDLDGSDETTSGYNAYVEECFQGRSTAKPCFARWRNSARY